MSECNVRRQALQGHYEAIGHAGGSKFWFHGLRNCFITVTERELMLPRSLTKRLANHARRGGVWQQGRDPFEVPPISPWAI